MFSFVFDEGAAAGQAYRALLFVNGWQFGKVRSTNIRYHLEVADKFGANAKGGVWGLIKVRSYFSHKFSNC